MNPRGRLPSATRPFTCGFHIPLNLPRDPPFRGSCEERDLTTSIYDVVKAGITGEIADRTKANLWRRRGMIMKTTAMPDSRLPLASWSGLSARLADFVALA